jgi:hypothetical protein
MIEQAIQAKERSLENIFFARQDEILLARMREADLLRSRREAISAASGLTDEAVLDELVALGLGPPGVAALALVPLVLVAWADRVLESAEREAVQAAARQAGLDRQPEAQELLDAWLQAPPGKDIAEAWRHYAGAVASRLTGEARATLLQATIGRAREVARAAGGFLGLAGTVSRSEERVLAELERAFAR